MDRIIRAVGGEFIKISVITAKDTVQYANLVHNCSPTACAALGRTLCAASMLGGMDFAQYVLVGSTVRSYLSWLKDTGRLTVEFGDGELLWKAI